MRVERIGDATLYLGDCREILPTLARCDAVISDPPYGQKQNTSVGGKNGRPLPGRTNSFGRMWPKGIIGDQTAFDPAHLLTLADIVLLWGAHKFHARLPDGGWLVWDKVPTGKIRDQGDGEAAWINRVQPMRIYRLLWSGLCVGSAARMEVTAGQSREHPTQKPVSLMKWCIQQAAVPAGGSIIDPYMGSGSTGVAAVQLGHPFVGLEIEPLYFDAACRRIEKAHQQPDLFVPRDAPAAQDLFL